MKATFGVSFKLNSFVDASLQTFVVVSAFWTLQYMKLLGKPLL